MEEGLVISLQFTAFDIESHSTCEYDHLKITDGDGTTLMENSCGSYSDDYYDYSVEGNVVIGGQIIGSSLPPDITSRTNIVKIYFSTNGDTSMPGWSVSWVAVTPGECQEHVWIFLDNFLILLFVMRQTISR